jgi:hypothetical protein
MEKEEAVMLQSRQHLLWPDKKGNNIDSKHGLIKEGDAPRPA